MKNNWYLPIRRYRSSKVILLIRSGINRAAFIFRFIAKLTSYRVILKITFLIISISIHTERVQINIGRFC